MTKRINKNLIIAGLILMVLVLPLLSVVSADLGTFKQNDCVPIRVLSNCSSVNLTEVNGLIINEAMTNMGGQTFNYSFCNTSVPDIYAFSWNPDCEDCSDGHCGNSFAISNYKSLIPIIFIYLFAIIFLIITTFVNEELFVYLSGLFFLIGGIYIMINGLGLSTISDLLIKGITYGSIGLGILLTIGAYVFNSYSSSSEEELE